MKNKNFIYVGLGLLTAYLAYNFIKSKKLTNPESALMDWKDNFDNKNLDAIVDNYSKDGILVSTFGDILDDKKKIKDYFKDLFTKDGLKVDFLGTPSVSELNGATVFTGLYNFQYKENGKVVNTKARYSFIVKKENGKYYILKQHSSVAN